MKLYLFIPLSLLLLAVACTPDKYTGIENLPEQLYGKWLYVNDENEDFYFSQVLSFDSHFFGISQQVYNDIGFCGGEMAYDENTQTVSLYCTKEHNHLKIDGEPIVSIRILNLKTDRLTAVVANKTIEYSRTERYDVPPYLWEKDCSENLNPQGWIPPLSDNGVDLGLSVCWAGYNVGSSMDYMEIGGRYGWGDVSGTYFTKNENLYPNANPPSEISGSEYDIVAQKWGNGWRLPTKEEMEELIDNCFVIWEKWCGCWTIVSHINGNEIKLPYGQIRDGKSTFYDECGYWTSTLDETTGMSYGLYGLTAGGDVKNIKLFKRSYGLQIRPVKDKSSSDSIQ